MQQRKTAGQLSLEAARDTTRYDGREIVEAQFHNIGDMVFESARNHRSIIDEDEYCVVMVRAGDPLIKGVVRQKYYSYPYLPSPRPEQAVWLYNKVRDDVKFLWSLPPAKVMAAITEAGVVSKKWQRTQDWCQAFFEGSFWHFIRQQHGIDLLSEHEYLNTHRQELIDASGDQQSSVVPEAFDFSKIKVDHISDTKTARLN